MNNLKKQKDKLQNPSHLTKRQRRKKLNVIKDTLHGGLGKKIFLGFGNGKSLICDICGSHIYECVSEIIKGKIYTYCDSSKCIEEINKFKKGI